MIAPIVGTDRYRLTIPRKGMEPLKIEGPFWYLIGLKADFVLGSR